jgi:hypothetical protein
MRARIIGVALMVACCTTATGASAETSGIHFDIEFRMSVDCDQPKQVSDVPVNGSGSGVLNLDKTGSLDLTLTALTTSTLHFEAKLGSQASPAPGGTTIMRILSGNRLQAIWELPTDQVIATVLVSNRGCRAAVDFKLTHGNTQYSMFDGQNFYFCSRPRLIDTSCSLK